MVPGAPDGLISRARASHAYPPSPLPKQEQDDEHLQRGRAMMPAPRLNEKTNLRYAIFAAATAGVV
jgi:hypothetical protein